MKATWGDTHDYLGMMLIFEDQDVLVDIQEYLKKMFEEFPIKFKRGSGRPSAAGGVDLFNQDFSKKPNDNHHGNA